MPNSNSSNSSVANVFKDENSASTFGTQIKEWNSTIQGNLNDSINHCMSFQITKADFNDSDRLHIYVGVSEGILTFYAISSNEDVYNNDPLSKLIPLNTDILNGLPNGYQFKSMSNTGADRISSQTAYDRVDSWNTSSVKEDWVNQKYSAKNPDGPFAKLNPLMSAFYINICDLDVNEDPNQSHHCILALVPIPDTDTYNADLIVANTFVSSETVHYNTNDMVHLSPPCSTAAFGVLAQLDLA